MAYQQSRGSRSGSASSSSRGSFGGRRSFGSRSRSRSGGGGKRGKENIHPSKFIKAAKPVEEIPYEAKHAFADFQLTALLHKNVADRGYTAPSPIQDQSIPLGLQDRDIIGIANTGTGKTVAFALPVINRLLSNPRSKVLIMAPTRELAQQILDEVKTFIKGSKLNGTILIGGAPMRPQFRALQRNPQIVIGTPGRIKDHIERKSLSLKGFNTIVLDEVDRMLDMGFVQDMRHILGLLEKDRQSFFFSATMDPKVRSLIEEFSNNPETISVKTGDTSDNVEQDVVKYKTSVEKIEKLHELLITERESKVLIFDETKRGADTLNKELISRGFKSDAIHGDKSQGQRQRALDKFKRNDTTILVATDVAARGIDVKGITHVINYATPQSYSDYVHRIGRAGRAGTTGKALTFITDQPERSSQSRSRSPRRSGGGDFRAGRPSQVGRPQRSSGARRPSTSTGRPQQASRQTRPSHKKSQ